MRAQRLMVKKSVIENDACVRLEGRIGRRSMLRGVRKHLASNVQAC